MNLVNGDALSALTPTPTSHCLHAGRLKFLHILLNLRSPRDYVGSSVRSFVRSFAPVVLP